MQMHMIPPIDENMKREDEKANNIIVCCRRWQHVATHDPLAELRTVKSSITSVTDIALVRLVACRFIGRFARMMKEL